MTEYRLVFILLSLFVLNALGDDDGHTMEMDNLPIEDQSTSDDVVAPNQGTTLITDDNDITTNNIDPSHGTTNKGNEKKNKDVICENLKKKDFNGKNGILAVGMIHKKLILVTLSFYVYSVPRSSLNPSLDRLYLSNKPEPISKVWPALWTDKQFVKEKDQYIYNAFTVMDSESDYFCITTSHKQINDSGPCYDINKKETFPGYEYYGPDNQVLLSANQPVVYYAMHKYQGKFQMAEFKFDSQRLRDLGKIYQSNSWRNLCEDNGQVFTTEDGTKCEKQYDIPVLKGFLDSKKIYLFGTKSVVVLDQQVYTSPGTKITPKEIKFGDFFFCRKGNVHDGKLGSGNLGTVIAIVLAVLLLLLCCLLLIAREALAKKEKKKKKSKTEALKADGPGGSSGVGSKHSSKSVRSNSRASSLPKLNSKGQSSSTALSNRSSRNSKTPLTMSKKSSKGGLSNASSRASARSSGTSGAPKMLSSRKGSSFSKKSSLKGSGSKSKRSASKCSASKPASSNKLSRFNRSVGVTGRSGLSTKTKSS